MEIVTKTYLACGAVGYICWGCAHMAENPKVNTGDYSCEDVFIYLFIISNLFFTSGVMLRIYRCFHNKLGDGHSLCSLVVSVIIIGIGVPCLREILRILLFGHQHQLTTIHLMAAYVIPICICIIGVSIAVIHIISTWESGEIRRYLIWTSNDKKHILELVTVHKNVILDAI